MWTHYLRCDECGVDAGRACRDEHDREALEVCDGRVLRVGDSADRLKKDRRRERASRPSRRDKPPDARPQARSRRARGILAAPKTAPCVYCGTTTRLWGAAVAAGRTRCGEPACQADRRRTRWAAERASRRERERASRPPTRTRPCVICGDPVPGHGVHANREAACPGACRAERWRRQYASRLEAERRRREAAPAEVPCHWCGVSLPGGGRRPGQRACCGAVPCRRQRDTEARRARGVPPREYRQPSVSVAAPPVACSWCEAPIAPHPRRSHAAHPSCGDLICDRGIKAAREAEKRRQDAAEQEQQPNA